MENSDGLKTVKEKLIEILSFVNISATEIENLLKTAASTDCESIHLVWRRGDQCIKFDAGIVRDEHSRRKNKVLIVNARTRSTTIHKNLEFSEGKFYGFQFEIVTPKS